MAAINPPNVQHPGDRIHGTMPTAGGKGVVHAPNTTDPGDRRHGNYPVTGGKGVIDPPNLRPHPMGHSGGPGS